MTPEHFVRVLRRLGVADPDDWVRSDLADDEPEVASALFLHELRQRLRDLYRHHLGVAVAGSGTVPDAPPEAVSDEGDDAARRLLASGADPEDLARVAQGAAAVTASTLVAMLDLVLPPLADSPADVPGWGLVETDRDGVPTGRCMTDLHSALNALYASDSA